MAKGVNKAIILGNLGADPVIRSMPNGTSVANVTVATSTVWRDKQSDKLVERTEWHRVVFFNRLAEIVGQYLCKGSKIYVEGSLRTNKWQDKTTGVDRFNTEIVADQMQMLGGTKQSVESQGGGNKMQADAFDPNAAEPGDGQRFDDDIPF